MWDSEKSKPCFERDIICPDELPENANYLIVKLKIYNIRINCLECNIEGAEYFPPRYTRKRLRDAVLQQ